jgi:hypothetical protein
MQIKRERLQLGEGIFLEFLKAFIADLTKLLFSSLQNSEGGGDGNSGNSLSITAKVGGFFWPLLRLCRYAMSKHIFLMSCLNRFRFIFPKNTIPHLKEIRNFSKQFLHCAAHLPLFGIVSGNRDLFLPGQVSPIRR